LDDADKVVATEDADGTTVIQAQRNRLVLENKLRIPVSRTVRFSQTDDQQDSVGNRWALLVDESDRDGVFVQYSLPDRRVGASKFSVRPQLMVQRAFEGETDSYPEAGAKPGARDVNQPIDSADLFGVDARWEGPLAEGEYKLRSNISSFNPKHLPNAVRASGIYERPFRMPVLVMFKAEHSALIAIAFGMVLWACKTFIQPLVALLRRLVDCLKS